MARIYALTKHYVGEGAGLVLPHRCLAIHYTIYYISDDIREPEMLIEKRVLNLEM